MTEFISNFENNSLESRSKLNLEVLLMYMYISVDTEKLVFRYTFLNATTVMLKLNFLANILHIR